MIRDLTDSINFEKMQLKQKEEKVSQIIIGKELNQVFLEHSKSIDKLTSCPEIK